MKPPKTLYALVPKARIKSDKKGDVLSASNGRDMVTTYEDLTKAKENIRPEQTIVVINTLGFEKSIQYHEGDLWFLPDKTKYRITGKKGKMLQADMVLPRSAIPPEDLSFNDQLFDAYTRHQITLLQYADSLSAKHKEGLSASQERIEARITRTLEGFEGLQTQRDADRIDAMVSSVLAIRETALNEMSEEYLKDVEDLADEEQSYWLWLILTIAPYLLTGLLKKYKRTQIITIVLQQKMMGADTPKDYIDRIKRDDLRNVESSIRTGVALSETAGEIIQRLNGTKQLDGTDGIYAKTERAFDAINRTIVNHTGNVVRNALAQENSSIFDKEVYVAVLDNKTTPLCRSLDGNLYPVGKGAIPPMHVGCRSKRVPLFKVLSGGKYRLKPEYEEQYKKEWERSNKNQTYSDFRKDRLFQDIGSEQVDMTYSKWVERQSTAYQDEILGKTRAKLFRDGELDLDRFINPNGGYYTLKDLAEKERQAFIDAGLDPDKYTSP